MASGLVNSSFKGFDFASSDAYDDINLENGTRNVISSEPETGNEFTKDFQRSRMSRCSPGAVYNQPDETPCQATLNLVEKCMKRHSDDIMRVLNGISSRLSHLELYCYNVDKSVGEMRLNFRRDYEETDARLASLDKHLEEVSRSVQILRDKQELAETQNVLARLQLAQKELSSPNASQHNVEQSTSPILDHHQTDDTFNIQNPHLAIVLHQQLPQQQSSPARSVEVRQPVVPSAQAAPQHTTQHQHYYLTPVPYQVQVQASQGQYLTSGTQYHSPQPMQPDISRPQFQQFPAQVSQALPQVHHFIQHQQQPQQIISTQVSVQQPPTPAPSRPITASGYPPQCPSQSAIHMNTPFSSMPQQVVTCANGYGGGPVQLHPPSQHINENFGSAYGEIYKSAGPHHSLSPANVSAYMMYSNEEVKRQPPPQSHFPQGRHTPATALRQHPQQVSIIHNNAHNERNHQHLIEKLVNLGFRADHVVPVIQMMEENHEAVDYNSVLNKLNVQSSDLHRGWTVDVITPIVNIVQYLPVCGLMDNRNMDVLLYHSD